MSNPNLYKDEIDRVYKVEGGGGGGIRVFDMEIIAHEDDDGDDGFIVHGATMEDLKNLFYARLTDDGIVSLFPLWYYSLNDEYLIKTIMPDGPMAMTFNRMENYLDGVRIWLDVSGN